MKNWRQRICSSTFACLLWVAMCFGLTSAVYLSWLDRLIVYAGDTAADWLSMGTGYLLQAVGIGFVCLLLRRNPARSFQRDFTVSLLLFVAISAPVLISDSSAVVIGFGLTANSLCGVIAGFYLYVIGRYVDAEHRALVFGGGYAIATVVVGLLALIDRGGFLHSSGALLLHFPLSIVMSVMASRLGFLEAAGDAPLSTDKPSPVATACVAVFLLSAVKNMGFSFPSTDISMGLLPELSRLPYAIGLAVAALAHYRSPKNGMVCTVATLIIPFIMLGLTSEPIPATICWGLDYLFAGFFSVFRVLLFLTIAEQSRQIALAPLGLLMGRLGDVAGTCVGLALAGNKIVLIAVTAVVFFPTVRLFYRLYQRLYEPQTIQQRSEHEVFEAFCLQNDLSSREREVLRMVIDNRSNGEISEALFISESTVKYHVRNVLQKTGCKNRGELQKKYALALYPHLESVVQTPVNNKAR